VTARLIAALVLAAGCRREPAPGDPCESRDRRCRDRTTELACEGGKLIEVPCKGPKGCVEEPMKLRCDVTGNATGDPCPTDAEGSGACLQAGKAWVVCRGGRYAVEPCRGVRGCREQGGKLACDQTVAEPGDACARQTGACSPDGLSALVCEDARFVFQARCTGEGGCSVHADEITCDLGKLQRERR